MHVGLVTPHPYPSHTSSHYSGASIASLPQALQPVASWARRAFCLGATGFAARGPCHVFAAAAAVPVVGWSAPAACAPKRKGERTAAKAYGFEVCPQTTPFCSPRAGACARPAPARNRSRPGSRRRGISRGVHCLRPSGLLPPAFAASRPEIIAQRLACGCTLEARLMLAETRLFHIDGSTELPQRDGPRIPSKGHQADYKGECVHILYTFKRWGVLSAGDATTRDSFWGRCSPPAPVT